MLSSHGRVIGSKGKARAERRPARRQARRESTAPAQGNQSLSRELRASALPKFPVSPGKSHVLSLSAKRYLTPLMRRQKFTDTQTDVHRVGDAIQPSYPLSSPSPPALNLSQHQGLFHEYSCLGNPSGQRSLAGCSPWGYRGPTPQRTYGPAERLLWPGRASPSAPQLLAFSPGKEQAAGVWETCLAPG